MTTNPCDTCQFAPAYGIDCEECAGERDEDSIFQATQSPPLETPRHDCPSRRLGGRFSSEVNR